VSASSHIGLVLQIKQAYMFGLKLKKRAISNLLYCVRVSIFVWHLVDVDIYYNHVQAFDFFFWRMAFDYLRLLYDLRATKTCAPLVQISLL
jgi:hypothetical protein